MITQYQFPGCPYALRTRIVMRAKGLPFTTELMNHHDKPPEVLAVSPVGPSPVLYDGPVHLRSSPVISEYLEERYPEPHLMPYDPGARAEVRLLMDDVADELTDATSELYRVFMQTPDSERTPEEAQRVRSEFHRALLPFEERLQHERRFLVADCFTLADVMLYTQLRAGLRLLGEDLPPELEALRAWRSHVEDQPAVKTSLDEEPG